LEIAKTAFEKWSPLLKGLLIGKAARVFTRGIFTKKN
jgi:hypothetical protein